jgi:hypothetical protein
MSEGAPLPEEPRHPAVHYEPTDFNLQSVLVFYLGLAFSLVIIGVGLWLYVLYLAGLEANAKRSDSPWTMEENHTISPLDRSRETRREEAGGEQSRLPSLPSLDGFDKVDQNAGRMRPSTIREQYQQDEEYLSRYGWVDRKAEVVHIPIEEAMKKLAGRLPARNGKDVDEFLEAPSRSSSGRVPRGGER